MGERGGKAEGRRECVAGLIWSFEWPECTVSQRAGERSQSAKKIKKWKRVSLAGEATRKADGQQRYSHTIKKTGSKHISQARKRHVFQTERVN